MGWNSHVRSYCPSFHTLAPQNAVNAFLGRFFSKGVTDER